MCLNIYYPIVLLYIGLEFKEVRMRHICFVVSNFFSYLECRYLIYGDFGLLGTRTHTAIFSRKENTIFLSLENFQRFYLLAENNITIGGTVIWPYLLARLWSINKNYFYSYLQKSKLTVIIKYSTLPTQPHMLV